MTKQKKIAAVLLCICALLLCACGAFFCFLALEKTGCGTLRPYMLLSFGAGCLLWRLGIRRAACAMIKLLRNKGKSAADGE